MKDEGPYVLEWLAYYRLIGFDHFVLFTNDCWDTTPELLDCIADKFGFVTHYDNSKPGFGARVHTDPQRRAYLRAAKLPAVERADYVLVADADEFLNIHAGDGTLNDLFAAAGPFEAISFTWNLFGSSGVVELQDEMVIDRFHAADARDGPVQERRLGVKTMFRNWNVEKLGVHRPFHVTLIKEGLVPIRWLNGAGEDHYEHYRALKWHATEATDGRSLAEMNHYPIKSAEAFLVKARRGSANTSDASRLDIRYWDRYNLNEREDRSIQRHSSDVRALVEDWFRECPELRELHHASVDAHKFIAGEVKASLLKDDPKTLEQLGLVQ